MDSSPQMKSEDAEDCTSTSMYLSCNEESTMSSVAFQTLEATLEDESMGSDLNKTLEPVNQPPFFPLKTVKDVNIAPITPLRPLMENLRSKNSWLALSSTPSKEQLLKTVDVTRGSDANRCMDLGFAFQEIDKENFSNRALSSLNTEDKENVFPEIGDGSSASSSAATTILEQDPLQISAAEVKSMPDNKEEIQVAKDTDAGGYESLRGTNDEEKKLEVNASPLDAINATDGASLVKNVDTKVSESDKMKPTVAMHNTNLPSKKASKILPPGQIYQNKLKIPDKKDVTLDPEVDVCHLINKMLRLSDRQQKKTAATGAFKKINEKPPMPSIAGEKRRVSFSQHMSIVVKTTLNSPARKLARKSIVGAATQQPRRSVMPIKSGEINQFVKSVGTTRKSMLPRAANAIDKVTAAQIVPPKKDKLNKLESLKHSKVGVMSDSKSKALPAPANAKPEAIFACKICKEKFLIKSLLDAHKRSHELDINPSKCLKRPSMVPIKTDGSIFGSENKCKYCDKKFALLRALHIHLLQNCPKIPPADKRKLQLTEMDHVEKAQLPNVFLNKQHSDASSSSATPRVSCNFNIGRRTFRSPIRPTPDIKNVNKKSSILGEEMMAPPCNSNLPQIKQKIPHSGVYCTPKKLIPCRSCNEVFKNILDYTNHNLSAHGNGSARKLLDLKGDALFKED